MLARKVPQNFQIHDIILQILFLGSFKNLWDGTELCRAHDLAEWRQSDLPFPDVFMTIDARTEGRLGVIQMPSRETVASDDSIEPLDGVPKSIGGGNIESGCKQMCGIQTSRKTVLEL